jgi:cysteinyl-tRNA synthetase
MTKILERFNFKVNYLLGITDIDDKIILKSKKECTSVDKIARKYEIEFFEMFKLLNLKNPWKTLRVTDNIDEILKLIKDLMDQNLAYQTFDGSIKFSIQNYLKLGFEYNKFGMLKKEYDKVEDFTIWKSRNSQVDNLKDDGLFSSPWGLGRPGWHIECAAASKIKKKVNFC